MTNEQPTIDDILARVKTYLKSELDAVNPTEQNSLVFSLCVAMANLSNDLNSEIYLDVIPNSFPQTAKSEADITKFSSWKNVRRVQASSASGKITAFGTVGTVIPAGSDLGVNNITYKTQSNAEINTDIIGITSATCNGKTVTITTVSNHNFASNIPVEIAGITPIEYNGTYVISASDDNAFTYSVPNTIESAGSGALMQASADIAVLSIYGTTAGANTNLLSGDGLTFMDSIEGLNNTAYVQFSNIAGGVDLEPFPTWQARIIERFRNPITVFNANNIKLQACKIVGVTKVWVRECTPTVGNVTVYFIRGNDTNIIPDANECLRVKAKILELRNVKDSGDDVFVLAPTATNTPITISNLIPNTVAMKTAVKNALTAVFQDFGEEGAVLKVQKLKTAISASFDPETGVAIEDFTLVAPTADIGCDIGVLPTLGTVTFA